MRLSDFYSLFDGIDALKPGERHVATGYQFNKADLELMLRREYSARAFAVYKHGFGNFTITRRY